MKRIKFTYYPFICWRVTKPMNEAKAKEIYNKAVRLHAGDSTEIEIINA